MLIALLAAARIADTAATPFPARELAPGVYAVVGDTGRGSEGRPNAGFIVTTEGVVVIDALASPRDGARLLETIRNTTEQPVKWLVLTHHHPDHHFGAIVLKRAGAKIIAHPDRRTLASEGGEDALIADWVRIVGLDAMRGFEFADIPDRPVTGSDTLRLGGRTIVVTHPGAAHTAGDLIVWLPKEQVLFAGDILVEDGVTMMVDGSARALRKALDVIDGLHPRVVVPGHGAIPKSPAELVALTRQYLTGLESDMRAAVEKGIPMKRAMASLPPADSARPVSLASRKRRNAVRVYLEEEKRYMGLEEDGEDGKDIPSSPSFPSLVSTDSLASWQLHKRVILLDVRTDVFAYLKGHLPGAEYLNSETLRASEGGIPTRLLSGDEYAALFSRLGIDPKIPVVIYSAGETRNIDATFTAWLFAGFGHPAVYVLDGGFFKWQLEQRPVVQPYPRIPVTKFAGKFAPESASLDDVKRAMKSKDAILVDARPPDQFKGEAGAQMRRGHIPGAIDHYWADDLTQEGFGHVWKDTTTLRASYVAQGITPDKHIIAYCNSTTEASHVHFTLRYLLGYPHVRVYVGSWTEWAERPELPIETGLR